jgi:hypothetical protein
MMDEETEVLGENLPWCQRLSNGTALGQTLIGVD